MLEMHFPLFPSSLFFIVLFSSSSSFTWFMLKLHRPRWISNCNSTSWFPMSSVFLNNWCPFGCPAHLKYLHQICRNLCLAVFQVSILLSSGFWRFHLWSLFPFSELQSPFAHFTVWFGPLSGNQGALFDLLQLRHLTFWVYKLDILLKYNNTNQLSPCSVFPIC